MTRLIVRDRLAALADARVGQVGVHEPRAEQLRRALGLLRALGDDAALLAAGEREDRDRVALRRRGAARMPPTPISTSSGCAPTARTTSRLLARRSRVSGDELARLLDQRRRVDRLGHVVVGAGAQRRDRVVEELRRGDDQRRDVGLRGLDAADEVDAVHPGQLDVGDDEVPAWRPTSSTASSPMGGPVARRRAREQLLHHGCEDLVVLDEEDVRLGRGALGGVGHRRLLRCPPEFPRPEADKRYGSSRTWEDPGA